MLASILFTLCALFGLVVSQLATGLYTIENREFFELLVGQSRSSIHTASGRLQDDAGVTWFITEVASTAQNTSYTFQNAQSLQYMSIDGKPDNGSIVVPRDAPFVWTIAQGSGLIEVDGFAVASPVSSTMLLLPRGTDSTQEWNFGGMRPLPAVYRIWNSATNKYLTGSAALPGQITATALDAQNALQYWSVSGTALESFEGNVANVKTGGYISISNGTLGTFSATKPAFPWTWQFTVGGGADRLSYFDTASPNVIAVNAAGKVILDAPDSGNHQFFVFVPADPTKAH